ncbi:MAG: HAD family hydrolase [Bacteroidia bacterium]
MKHWRRLKQFVSDKTRTITYGNPVVSDVITLNNTSREELLACNCRCRNFQRTSFALAIVDASRSEGFCGTSQTELYKSHLGKGATAKCLVCEDEIIYAGKLDFIKEHHGTDAEAERIVEQLSQSGKNKCCSKFWQKCKQRILAPTHEIKSDSAEVIKNIKELKIEPVMLTGDSVRAAHHVAQQVGIKTVYGGLLPEDKAENKGTLKQYKNSGYGW